MKKMLSIFGMVFVLASVGPSALATIKATPPNTQTVTCPDPLHGVVIVSYLYKAGSCSWSVRLDGYDGYTFDLGKADKITFDGTGVMAFGLNVCFYKFYDNGKYVGRGFLSPNCGWNCKVVQGSSNTLSCNMFEASSKR